MGSALGHEAGRLRRRARIEALTHSLCVYAVVPDLYYVRERARKKGDSSVGLFDAMLGKAPDITPILCGHADGTFPVAKVRSFENAVARVLVFAAERIRAGLLSPHVVITYAGDPELIPTCPATPSWGRRRRSAAWSRCAAA